MIKMSPGRTTGKPAKDKTRSPAFFKDKTHWGYAFCYGHLEIPHADFELTAAEMLAKKSAAITLSVAGM